MLPVSCPTRDVATIRPSIAIEAMPEVKAIQKLSEDLREGDRVRYALKELCFNVSMGLFTELKRALSEIK